MRSCCCSRRWRCSEWETGAMSVDAQSSVALLGQWLVQALTLNCFVFCLQVAEHVGSKNKTQCETHYADVYCSTTDLLPDPTKALTRAGAKTEGAPEDTKSADVTVKSEDAKRSATPAAAPASGRPNAASAQVLSKQAHAISKPKPKNGLGYLVGFIPNRGGQLTSTTARRVC